MKDFKFNYPLEDKAYIGIVDCNGKVIAKYSDKYGQYSFSCGLLEDLIDRSNQYDKHVERIAELENGLRNLLVNFAYSADDQLHYEFGIGDFAQDEEITKAEKLLER